MISRNYLLHLQNTGLEAAQTKWNSNVFYTRAVSLGIDIGLEGIGIYLRKGREEIYAKTVDVSDVLPGADALEKRRLLRHARRNRANKRTRLSRLDALLVKHGMPLPWKDNRTAYEHSDPFKMRYRAVRSEGNGLGSKEALSIAIRSCVALRGYDYGRFSEDGEHPWGRSNKLADAFKWLTTATIDEGLAAQLQDYAHRRELAADKKAPDAKWAEFEEEIDRRFKVSSEHTLETVLQEHFKGAKHDNLRQRARGFAFPRRQIWAHLVQIVRRHAAMIDDAEGFLAALGINPDDRKQFPALKDAAAAREKAIFWYNRKSLLEMEAHWAKKRKDCPYASRLGLGEQKTSARGHGALRLWAMLEFGITRRVEITYKDAEMEKAAKAAKQKVDRKKCHKEFLHALSAIAIKALVDLIAGQYGADIAVPVLDKELRSKAKKKAREIIEEDVASHSGIAADLGPKPSATTKGWNESFYDQLDDIVAPNAIGGTGSLHHGTAERLFSIATADGTDFTVEGYNRRLVDLEFYDWRRESVLDWGVYPQVEFLLGRRIQHGKRKGEVSRSCQGFLRQLFAGFQAESHPLSGISAPDFVTIEVVGDPPRTQKQKDEILKEHKKKRDERREAFDKSPYADSGVASRRRRMALHKQQKGHCPYTGDPLPDDPLDDRLEIEHIYPAEMGGLSVDDNLVLTFRQTNGLKAKQTPLKWLGAERLRELAARNADMRWSALKREVFLWGTRREDDPAGKWPKHYDDQGMLLVPDFGNMTRTAQLARQLYAAAADWLGIAKQPEECARRIATPSGWLASQALRSWLPDYRKDRADLTHHLIDAAVLSHIPPREGMNSVHCGGIFYAERVAEINQHRPGEMTSRLVTRALPGLLDAASLQHWLPGDSREYAQCPVLLRKSRSKTGSLGDSTFWRQADRDKPDLAQREGSPFNPADYKGNPDKLRALLQKMGINERKDRQWRARNLRKGLPPPPFKDVIPTIQDIEKYLEAATATLQSERGQKPPVLRLRDGKDGKPWTPITKIWKWNSKGSFGKGLGWSGRLNEQGTRTALRSLELKYDRLEIWLGFDEKAARKARASGNADWEAAGWQYQKRLIPNATALRHLKQLGLRYDRDARAPAPAFMQNKPDKLETHQTLRDLIQGKRLLPFSKKVGSVRRGDVFKVSYDHEGGLTSSETNKVWSTFLKVTSTTGDNRGTIEMACLLISDKKLTPLKECTQDILSRKSGVAADLASLLGLPSAFDMARSLISAGRLKTPTVPDDPSPDTPRRRGGRTAPAGQADLLRQEDRA